MNIGRLSSANILIKIKRTINKMMGGGTEGKREKYNEIANERKAK